MSRYDEREQDHPLDESTSARVQHFDADGYVLPDVDAARSVPPAAGAATDVAPGAETDEPEADDGLFNDQTMPTADGELSHPDPGAGFADEETHQTAHTERTAPMTNADGALDDGSLSQPDRVIGIDDNSIVPGPEPVPAAPGGVPVDPDYNPEVQPNVTPDEPAPFAPDEGVGSGDAREVRNPAI